MEKTPHILIVDDDREIRDLLSRFLQKHGFRASTAADGREMRKILSDARIDLIVLDVMMPGETGLQICAQLRAQGIPGPSGSGAARTPIIMLTAAGEDTDRIIGLEMGADDYLPKPFNPRELVARIRAILRRAEVPPIENRCFVVNAVLSVDLDKRHVAHADGGELSLTSAEFDLLGCFLTRPNRVLSREQLMDWTRGRQADPLDRTIDVQVSRLRKKIERDAELIKTVRNAGYIFIGTVKER
jgi:two-component system OmpR family response regulator